jgi:hypothetical protein
MRPETESFDFEIGLRRRPTELSVTRFHGLINRRP